MTRLNQTFTLLASALLSLTLIAATVSVPPSPAFSPASPAQIV